MRGTPRTLASIGSALAIAVLLAACAKTASPSSSGPSTTPSTVSSSPATGVAVDSVSVGLLGSALVNASGRTLYVLSADRGGKVTCTSSSCTGAWPPVLLAAGAHATAGSGVDSSKLGTVKTPSGALQVTYNHWPLYTFSGDTGSGQTNGQGINSFGGVWHPIAPTGQPIVGGPSSTPTGSGYGY